MGMFAFAEVISQLETREKREVFTSNVKARLPTLADLKASWKSVLRGTSVGVVLGTLPGGGPVLSSFAAYTVEKRLAADPSRFGKGAMEGVAALNQLIMLLPRFHSFRCSLWVSRQPRRWRLCWEL